MEQKTEASQAVNPDMLDAVTSKVAEFYPQSLPRDMEKNQRLARAILRLVNRAALKAQPAPTDPYQLDDDDDARFPNDTNVVILHIDRYWHLRGCEDICAALDAKPAPTEAQGKPAWAPAYLSGTVLQNTNSGGGKVTLQFDTVGSAAAAFEDFIVMQEGKAQLSGNSGELQPSGNTGELAQGEGSARLDAMPMWEYYGCTEAEWVEFKAWSKNRARASAETGGVKP